MCKFVVVVSAVKPDEVEFKYVQTIKPIKIDILKYYPEIKHILFSKSGGLKENSVFAINEQLFNEIVNQKYYGNEASRMFFIEANNEGHFVRNFINDNDSLKLLKLNSLKQLKSIKSSIVDKEILANIKNILRKYELMELYENINLEKIAYYKSFHHHGMKYGIYLSLKNFANYLVSTVQILNIQNKFNFDYKTVRHICVEKVLQHERFHYLVELFITFEELASKDFSKYDYYSYIYNKTFRTDDCLAEALANYFAKMYFIYKEKKNFIRPLNIMFERQAPGYRIAANIDETNDIDIFIEFEKQLKLYPLFNNNISKNKTSIMFKEISQLYLKERLPLAKLEISKKINIPIFIVNDGMSKSDFNELLKLIFPNVF